MKVAIQGSRSFNDYSVFLRSMGVALSPLKQSAGSLEIYSNAPHKINNFLRGFVNLTENDMKARGMSIKSYKVSYDWLSDHMEEIDYFIYLSSPGEKSTSPLVLLAESYDVETGIFQY